MIFQLKTPISLLIFAALVALGLSVAPSLTHAAGCGGDKQKVCEPTSAKKLKDKFNPKPKGANKFNGKYWTCTDGYKKNSNRKWSHSKACKKKKKRKPAKNHGPVKNKKPSGSFYNVKTKAFWSCPSGYDRNTGTSITSSKACKPGVGDRCKKGMVSYRKYCYKKNDCGASNERPCKLTEKSPSGVRRCKKGLSYDFIAGKCISSKTALCLLATRTINAVHNGGKSVAKLYKTFNDINQKFDKYTGDLRGEIIGAVPGLGKVQENAEKKRKWAEGKLGKGADQEKFINDLVKQIEKISTSSAPGFMKDFMAYSKTLKKNSKKILKEFGKDKICTGNKDYRNGVVAKLGFEAPKLKKSMLQELESYGEKFAGSLVGSAHAAAKQRFFLQLGVSVSANYYVGGTVEIALITDFKKYNHLHVIVGPSGTVGMGGEGGVAVGVFPKVSTDDFPGWSSGIAVSGSPKKKWPVSGGLAMLMSGDFKLQGVGAAVAVGAGSGPPVNGAINYTHDWQLTK